MKKKKTTATATTTPSSSQKQSVLSRFFTQIAPPKKLAEENGSNTQQQQQHPQSITPPPPPTTTTKKIPAKKSTTPQKPPKKRLKKIVNDDDDDDDDEIFKDDSSDEVFDDDSDEDYSSGDNEPSYFSDEDYESDSVSERDDKEEEDSFSDELESDEDTKKRRKQKQKRTTSTKRQKKEDALKDFENDTNSDSNKCDNSASDETTAADDAENVSSSTKECVGLEKYSIDSTEEVAINEKRHKAFVNKLRRIQNEKDTKSTGVSGKPKYTPMEQQVLEMKRQYPDCVLAFEVGYKFMLYGRDAEIANEVLKVYCYQDHNFLTAMIPTVRLNFHVRRLVQAGHKVGLVRQTEVAAVKALSNSKHKPFTRSLTDLYTPATLVGSDLESVETDLSSSRNYMLCIYEHPRDGTISFVGVDLSAGDVVYDTFKDDGVRSMLDTVLTHLGPRELLVPKKGDFLTAETSAVIRRAGDAGAMVTEYDTEEWNYERSLEALEAFYCADWAVLLSRVAGGPVVCLGALLAHLRRFSLERGLRAASGFRRFAEAAHMRLSGSTIRNLELLGNRADGGERGSLLWVIGQTATPFGRRLLARWLTAPLLDPVQINARLDAVEELSSDSAHPYVEALRGALTGLPDFERGLSHIQHRRCSPREFVTLMDAFAKVAGVIASLKGCSDITSALLQNIVESMPGAELNSALAGILGEINRSIIDKENSSNNNNNNSNLFIHPERFPEVQKRMTEVAGIESELNEHLGVIQKQLGGGSGARKKAVSYTHMAKEEYLIELSAREKAPGDWIKVNATTSVTRWRTPFMASALARLNCARALLTAAADTAWTEFLGEVAAAHYAELRALVCRLGELDCLFTFARLAATLPGYVRPRVLPTADSGSAQVRIVGGRNPVAEAILLGGGSGGQYVPNTVELGEGVRCAVVTGPNMGGKTSLLRQVALIAILAQAGCFVPAEEVVMTPLDAIFTRMGAADCIEKGQSTYFVELAETAPILREATPRSLVILDELGRGTSTHDGMAIAYAALWHLIRKARCLTLFVTHYTTLAQAVQAVFPTVAENFHMAYLDESGDDGGDDDGSHQKITFLYKFTKGISPSSFGLNVARIAGFPESIIDEAAKASKSLERVTSAKVAKGTEASMRHFADLCRCLGVRIPDAVARLGETGSDAQEMSPEDRLREIWFSVNLLNHTN